MPANIAVDAQGKAMAVFANEPAWHHEGTVLDTNGEKGLTVKVALPESGLDWQVEKVPAYALWNGQHVEIDGRWAVQRTTDGRVFGTVGKTWQPFQNHQGFALVDDLIAQASAGTGRAWIESGGALDDGKKVWLLVHIDAGMQIAGEDIASYLLFTNGHDGRTSVTAATTNVRVVCQNTLAWALENNPRVVRVRHTSKAADRIKEAAHVLNMRNQYSEQQAIQGEFLAEQTLDSAKFDEFLRSLMPITEDQVGNPAETMISNRRDGVRRIYMQAPNLENIRGTRWGALQAVVEYADYGIERKGTQETLKAQWGINPNPLKDDAFSILKDTKMRPLRIEKKLIVA